jgi:beta-glucanase (GH16 family)
MKRTIAQYILLALPFLGNLVACQKPVNQPKDISTTATSTIQYAATATTVTGPFSTLVWSDEFDGTAVNTSNWTFETGGGGWGNNEKQYYQAANATVANGTLVITAKKQRVKANSYTSARLKTQGKREFTYGKFEARIKLPLGQGLWPAFWMLGANINTVSWPACGETDIMEHINTENTIYGTIHWDNNGHASYGGNTTTTPSDYHIYAVEWDSAAIRWYIDGVKFHEANILNNINGTEEFHRPFFILLNMAVGGNWPGQTIDNSKLPASMYIDYVRVYQ